MRDVSDDIGALRRRLDEASTYLKVDELRARRPQLETEASRPDLWDDPDRARKVTGELASVSDDLDLYDREVSVEFVAQLRGMVAFDDVQALVKQMDHDVALTRATLDI